MLPATTAGPRRRWHRAHKRATADPPGDVAEFGQSAVGAHRGEVVDAGLLSECSRGRQPLTSDQVPVLDRGAHRGHQLIVERANVLAVDVGQVEFV